MFITGLIIGIVGAFAVVITRSWFVVSEGEVAILTSFGRPVGGSPAHQYGPGLHKKAVWHQVHRASAAELLAPLSYHGTNGVLAHDGTPLRVEATVRYRVLPGQLERYCFGVDHADEHFAELFESIVRGTVAGFAPGAGDATAYSRLRRDRRAFVDELRRACATTLGERYGIELVGVDLSSLSPPRELEEALNAVLHAGAMAGVQLEQASATCEQRLVAATEGVAVATQKAQAVHDEMLGLAEFLRELKRAGTLDDYVHHRRSEILNQAKTVFVRSDR
jgi:regulator of protease activity HflC (stomatin/prohibitin superfamily)